MKHIFLSLLLMLFTTLLFAQQKTDSVSLNNKKKNKFSVGVGGGLTYMIPNVGNRNTDTDIKGLMKENYGFAITQKAFWRIYLYVAYNKETFAMKSSNSLNKYIDYLNFNSDSYSGGVQVKLFKENKIRFYTITGYKYSIIYQEGFWRTNEQSITVGGKIEYSISNNLSIDVGALKMIGLTHIRAFDNDYYKLQYFNFDIGFSIYLF